MAKSNFNIVEHTKELLSDPRNRIKLDDFVTEHLKSYLDATSIDQFPVHEPEPTQENFVIRLQKYEEVVNDFQQIVILLAKWGEAEQLTIIEKVFRHIAEADKGTSGISLWLHFSWYPIQILMYSAGIAALSTRNYNTLNIILATKVRHSISDRGCSPIVEPATNNLADIHIAFKWIPGQDRKYVPRSEHLFELLSPIFEDLLFLGRDYERLFDDFEVFFALVYADTTNTDWAPIGRFGWKNSRNLEDNPFIRIVKEAEVMKENWPPIKGRNVSRIIQEIFRDCRGSR